VDESSEVGGGSQISGIGSQTRYVFLRILGRRSLDGPATSFMVGPAKFMVGLFDVVGRKL